MNKNIILITLLIICFFPFFQASAVTNETWTNIYNRIETLENKTASQEQEIKDLKLNCSAQNQPLQTTELESRVNILEARLEQLENFFKRFSQNVTNLFGIIINKITN